VFVARQRPTPALSSPLRGRPACRKRHRSGTGFRSMTFWPHDGASSGNASDAGCRFLKREGVPLSLLARLAPHLPYVRRYARALTGDQTTGDHYVRVALEALAAGERVLEANLTPRVALYHVFHAIWCSSGAQLEPAQADEDGDDASRRLMRIAPRSRQAFLLTALEGFTPSEAAQILGADFSEVEKLIAEAQAEIDAELATDVLIIEDEPVIAADIEALVKELGHSVVDIAATRTEAVDAVARTTPGLVLA